MQPHLGEINSKPRLEISTLGFRQRLAVGNREHALEYLAPYVYRVVGFGLPSVCNRHEIESQKTRKAVLTIPDIHYLASQGHSGHSKHLQVNPGMGAQTHK
jgi:hypothetical protein